MTWHTLRAEDVLRELDTVPHGLTKEEAPRRLLQYGKNTLPEVKPDSYLTLFLRQFASPLIYLLLLAAGVVYLMGDTNDALIILFVLLFNAIIGVVQEGKAQNTLRALNRFAETRTTVVRDGRELIIRDTDVVPGDIVVLNEGTKIPADGRILEAHTLQVNEASLTGESEPVAKRPGELEREDLPVADRTNMVFKGSTVTSGNARMVVVATGLETHLGTIATKIATIDTAMPLAEEIKRLSRAIIIVVAIGGALLFGAGVALGNEVGEMFAVVIALSVSVIPEGLPVVLTMVLAAGVYRMGKKHVLVKRLQAVEALGSASVIAVDKTGTITRNELTVERIFTGGRQFSVSGVGYEPKGDVSLDGTAIDAANHRELLFAGKVASLTAVAQTMYSEEDARWRVSGDPTEAALLVFGRKVGFEKEDLLHEAPLLAEIPFDYELAYHATLHEDGEKNLVSVVGAPERILKLCEHICWEGKEVPFTPALRKQVEQEFTTLSGDGLRVIAFANRRTTTRVIDADYLSGLVFGGFYAMRDGLRPEVHEAMRRAMGAGIKVVMITGDHALTATAIARETGIHQEGDEVVTGEEIDQLNDLQLADRLDRVSVFARVTPEHKMRIVSAYRTRGDIIAMTGDGVNDAPPLVAADLGVAMGITGTEVAKEAADLILLDDNFGSIVAAIEEGRTIYRTIKKVVLYLFSTGVGEALTIIAAILIGLPLPLLASQIIWLNFVTDGFLVIALGLEKKEAGLLHAPSQKRARLIDRGTLGRMLLMGGTMVIGTLFLFTEYLDGGMTKALTISLTTLAIFQWFNVWNCRSATASIFTQNPFKNHYLVLATLAVIILHTLALSVPFLQDALHTTMLTPREWLDTVLVASSVLVVEEFRKLIARRRISTPEPPAAFNQTLTRRRV